MLQPLQQAAARQNHDAPSGDSADADDVEGCFVPAVPRGRNEPLIFSLGGVPGHQWVAAFPSLERLRGAMDVLRVTGYGVMWILDGGAFVLSMREQGLRVVRDPAPEHGRLQLHDWCRS